MTQPTTYGGRPLMPASGVPTPELRVARFRGHGRQLFWPAAVFIVVAAACGYFYGNLPAPIQNWMLLAAAAVILLVAAVLPFAAWWAHSYTITTRRVIERSGVFGTHSREITHVRGYSIDVRRGLLQRMVGAGTLTLSNGVDAPMRMKDIPSVGLVHEALVDQVEVSQILAHRDAQPLPPAPPLPPPPVPGR